MGVHEVLEMSRRWTTALVMEMYAMYVSGCSGKVVAERYGVRQNCMMNMFAREGLQTRTPPEAARLRAANLANKPEKPE